MKLTDDPKKKIDNAKSANEVKDILNDIKKGAEAAGIIIEDEDLDKASGGGDLYPKYHTYHFV